jgi:adenine specific DNA methylase Mod
MQAFTAKGTNESWHVERNGQMVYKVVNKTTKELIILSRIMKTYRNGGKALPAFHAEKKKALAKGLEISNFDSTVSKPKIVDVKAVVRPKKVKIFGPRYALES